MGLEKPGAAISEATESSIIRVALRLRSWVATVVASEPGVDGRPAAEGEVDDGGAAGLTPARPLDGA